MSDDVTSQVRTQVWDQVRNLYVLRGQVRNRVWNQLDDVLWDRVRGQVRNRVWTNWWRMLVMRNDTFDAIYCGRNTAAYEIIWKNSTRDVYNAGHNGVMGDTWDVVKARVLDMVTDEMWEVWHTPLQATKDVV